MFDYRPPVFGWKDENYNERIDNHKCMISQDIGYQIFATCNNKAFDCKISCRVNFLPFSDDVLSAANFHSDALLEDLSGSQEAHQ